MMNIPKNVQEATKLLQEWRDVAVKKITEVCNKYAPPKSEDKPESSQPKKSEEPPKSSG